MKLNIVTDQLVERDLTTTMVESMLSIDADVEISSLIHDPERVLGPILNHKNCSTFLSKFIHSKRDLYRWPILAPKVWESFKPSSADIYLVISQGIAHHIKTPKGAKRIDYILRPLKVEFSSSWIKKLYSGLRKRSSQRVSELENPIFSSHALARFYQYKKDYSVVPAPFVSRDFPVMCEFETNKNILLFVDDLSIAELRKFVSSFDPEYTLKIISNNKMIEIIKEEFSFIECHSEMDNHTLYIELLKSCLLIDMRDGAYPEKVLCSLATGVPVILYDNDVNREYLSADVAQYCEDFQVLPEKLNDFLENKSHWNGQLLRRYALRFNERVFKNKILKML